MSQLREQVIKFLKFLKSFCDRERTKPSVIKITALIFQVKNSTIKLSGLSSFREDAKKLQVRSRTRSSSRSILNLNKTVKCSSRGRTTNLLPCVRKVKAFNRFLLYLFYKLCQHNINTNR